ncbi:unnamed protein product [Prunus armeniaca]|uniref:Uncharacterized protein n=1 Tax=Prunus armeniaca TaxID=36596 RepID=A0A6J5WFC3_PRUAR|nr:unnamed protein product [Prunus armeniaca]CAB4299013.1 unnamed protein product [Prunus armeniaca]
MVVGLRVGQGAGMEPKQQANRSAICCSDKPAFSTTTKTHPSHSPHSAATRVERPHTIAPKPKSIPGQIRALI